MSLTKTPYRSIHLGLLLALMLFTVLSGCQSMAARQSDPITLEPIASSEAQWTGIAVADNDRIFVNYPRWSDNVPISVAELLDGKPTPFPNRSMNAWKPGKDPETHLICVQALYVDEKNRLWILDPANPLFKGVIPGGPKLLQVDLSTDRVVRTYRFDSEIAPEGSYLNDVRIDTQRDFAYITDSGEGALIALDLKKGDARRVLDDHRSTTSEDVVLTIGGSKWLPEGTTPQVHADGIAYDPGADMVYYQALTGRTMYRIPGASLRQFQLSEDSVASTVETVGQTGASDGLIFGPDGKIYISALEHDAIFRTTPDGEVETVVQSKAIAWPDSFSFGPSGQLYFTTARIHEGAAPKEPYGIYRISVSP